MAGPRDYLKKAGNNRRIERRQAHMPPQPVPMRIGIETPAPIQGGSGTAPEPKLSNPPVKREETPMEYRIAPQPMGGHNIYRELMRSHDRMGTRHLPKKD